MDTDHAYNEPDNGRKDTGEIADSKLQTKVEAQKKELAEQRLPN